MQNSLAETVNLKIPGFSSIECYSSHVETTLVCGTTPHENNNYVFRLEAEGTGPRSLCVDCFLSEIDQHGTHSKPSQPELPPCGLENHPRKDRLLSLSFGSVEQLMGLFIVFVEGLFSNTVKSRVCGNVGDSSAQTQDLYNK